MEGMFEGEIENKKWRTMVRKGGLIKGKEWRDERNEDRKEELTEKLKGNTLKGTIMFALFPNISLRKNDTYTCVYHFHLFLTLISHFPTEMP